MTFALASSVWHALLFLCLAALLWTIAALAKISYSLFSFAALAVAALGFGPLTSALALGQLALPVALAIAAAFAARNFLSVLFSAAVACAQPNLAIALIGSFFERRRSIAITGGAVAFAALSLGVAGLRGAEHYVNVLQQHGSAERLSAIQITPEAIAYGFGAPPSLAGAIGIIVAIAAAVIWVFFVAFVRDRIATFCATCALLPFVAPFFHEHDLAILFVPAVLLVLRVPLRRLSLVLAGAILCATDWLGLAQRPDGLAQTLLLVGAFAIAVVLLRSDVDRRSIATAAAMLLLVGVGGFAARAHVLPVWPDAMRSIGLAHAGNLAAIWHSEQVSTGLFARDPLWALLRCASVAGAAFLAYAAFLSSRSPADSKTSAPAPA